MAYIQVWHPSDTRVPTLIGPLLEAHNAPASKFIHEGGEAAQKIREAFGRATTYVFLQDTLSI